MFGIKSAVPKEERLEVTLKAAALIALVESGVIMREANGDVPTEAFERFWEQFEPEMTKAYNHLIWNAL